jgi:acyl-coenzyme A synthetase/AMP-(fatty) acid ligase
LEKIFPIEIEKVLESFPFISEAAAFGITSKIHGQIPVAAIVIKEHEKIEISSLKKSLHEILGIRRPREIYITNKIPRNSQGKILRNELNKMFDESK